VPEPREPYQWYPSWLESSGLPDLLKTHIRSGLGWLVLRKVVELDCERNRWPEAVEVSLEELGRLCGVESTAARKVVLALRKLRVLACFLPETDEENALLKVRTPLRTPLSPEQLCGLFPNRFASDGYFRYAQVLEEAEAAEEPQDLQEVVDLYFNTVGLKMNSFVLDELRLLTERFGREEIRAVFRRAQRLDIRSLSWIAGQLAKARTLELRRPSSGKESDS
jgi:hypothetical protein